MRRQEGRNFMKPGRLAMAAFAVGFSIGAAQAITVNRSVTVDGAPLTVWWDIGDFCEISVWHPVIADCDDYWKDGVLYRTLSVEGGGTVLEKRTEKGPLSYSYEIIDSPLPVQNYRATFKVFQSGDKTTIDWTGWFDAKDGVTDAEAAATMAGVYEAGLAQIVKDRTGE
jgi:hypothetical protein